MARRVDRDAAYQRIVEHLGRHPGASGREIERTLKAEGLSYTRARFVEDVARAKGQPKGAGATGSESARKGGYASGAKRQRDIKHLRRERSQARRDGNTAKQSIYEREILQRRLDQDRAARAKARPERPQRIRDETIPPEVRKAAQDDPDIRRDVREADAAARAAAQGAGTSGSFGGGGGGGGGAAGADDGESSDEILELLFEDDDYGDDWYDDAEYAL